MSRALILGIAGAGGAGVLAGEVLMKAAALLGYHAMLTKSFGSQIRGGESSCRLRLAADRVLHSGGSWTWRVAFNWEDFRRFGAELPVAGATSGRKLYTGVFFREPSRRPTFEELARERRRELGVDPARRARILDALRIEGGASR